MLNLEDGIRQAASMVKSLRAWQRWLLLIVMIVFGAVAIYARNRQNFGIFEAIEAYHYELFVVGTFGFLLIALLLRAMSGALKAPEAINIPKEHTPVFMMALGGLLLAASFFWIPRDRSDFMSVSPSSQEALSFLETLPKDVLVAGEPCWLSDVPMLGRRMVLWSCEHMPRSDETLILDTLEANYAETLSEVGEFCERYDVDYMVVDRRFVSEEALRGGGFFFEPYASALRSRIGSQTTFALQQAPDNLGALEFGELVVFPCSPSAFADGPDLANDVPQVSVNATLDDGLILEGYDVHELKVEPGGGVALTLHWLADGTPDVDYTVFVHLVDWSVPRVAGQSDSYPVQGRRPTSTWQTGDKILDTHYFTLPEELPPGQYELIAGMYRLDTLERLPVIGEDVDYIRLAGPFQG